MIKIFDTLYIFTRKNIDMDELIKRGWVYHRVNSDFDSYYYFKTNKSIMKYIKNKREIFIQISCSELLWGDNLFGVYENNLPDLYKLIQEHLKIGLGKQATNLPDISEWQVSKIDYCYNYFVSEEDKKNLLNLFKKIPNSRLKQTLYPTSSFYHNKSRKVILYSKFDERQKNSKHSIFVPSMKQIFRFEIGYRRGKIKSRFKEKSKVKDLLKESVAKQELENYLQESKVNFKLRDKKETLCEIDRLFKKSMAVKLKDFICFLNTHGVDKTKDKYKKATFYNYSRYLREEEINIFCVENPIFMENLSIDIDQAKKCEKMMKKEILMLIPKQYQTMRNKCTLSVKPILTISIFINSLELIKFKYLVKINLCYQSGG